MLHYSLPRLLGQNLPSSSFTLISTALRLFAHSGYRYSIPFIDDDSRLRSVLLMTTKGEAFTAFKQFNGHAEAQIG